MRLLDTDVLVDVLRNYAPALQWLESLVEAPYIPGLVYLELIQGCNNKDDVRAVEALVAPLELIWPRDTDFESARKQFAELHLRESVGLLDMLIGTCCAGRDAILCTNNVKHYRHIPGLKIEQPYSKVNQG